jgi:GT2 family glycosyltransferase
MPDLDLSVIILNFNTCELLLRCLRSLEAYAPEAEVVVVDNASPDNSAAAVQQGFPGARLIVNNENVGFARAMNKGLASARGALLLALNADTELLSTTVRQLVEAAARWPGGGIFGPAQFVPDPRRPGQPGRHLATAFADPTLLREVGRLLLFADHFQARLRLGPWQAPAGPARPVDWLVGAALLFRRECLAGLGGFDERSFMYGEDWDVCYRARCAGWQVLYVPQATLLHHENAAGTRQFGADRLARVVQGGLFFHQKHYGRLSAHALAVIYVAGALLRLGGGLLAGPFRHDGRGWRSRSQSQWNVIRMALSLLRSGLSHRAA